MATGMSVHSLGVDTTKSLGEMFWGPWLAARGIWLQTQWGERFEDLQRGALYLIEQHRIQGAERTALLVGPPGPRLADLF